MKTLTFDIAIHAPRARVWDTMLGAETYRVWAAAFSEGTYFVGSWEAGSPIRFLAPSGDGMLSEIAEAVPFEFVSIRHLGMVENGVEDTTSDKVRAWAPAYETYRFSDDPAGCRLVVNVDAADEWQDYMQDTFPVALARLRSLCEA